MSCLIAPGKTRQIRPPDYHFVKCLKEEMLTTDVAPIVALVNLTEGEEFNPAHAEAYQYETIGGNHSRIALQEIATEEQPTSTIKHLLVSVYYDLSDEMAQHLAHRHNRATEYTSKMTTQDKVC